MSSETSNDQDAEIAAIAQISAALRAIEDPVARGRVLSYVLARFSDGPIARSAAPTPVPRAPGLVPAGVGVGEGERLNTSAREIGGIARLTDDGQLKVTVRDLKAKSGLDAATRLAHVAIYAHQEMAGQPLSSRKGLTPLLREWRLYDGNTRRKLGNDRGILRDGDNLSLDAHAKMDAQRYIEDILNPDVQGSWRPK
jgi:hypothetical protein